MPAKCSRYAARILSSSSSCMALSIRSNSAHQNPVSSAAQLSSSFPQGVSPASEAGAASRAICAAAQSSGRAWHCIRWCSSSTSSPRRRSSRPSPTVSASRRKSGSVSTVS